MPNIFMRVVGTSLAGAILVAILWVIFFTHIAPWPGHATLIVPLFVITWIGGIPDRSGLVPKIAWAGVGGQRRQFNFLQRAVSKAMGELGYEPPEHHILPHVTVGRFDTDNREWCLEMSDCWRNMPFAPTKAFLVDEIGLYASERDGDGRVTYVIQDRWQLNSLLLH